MEEENIITITLPDGKTAEYKALFSFDHEDSAYVVFTEKEDSDENSFFVAKVTDDGTGSGTLSEVEDEEVYAVAEELLDEYYAEDEDCHCHGDDCDCDERHGDDCHCHGEECDCDDCKN